jgi:hypothetical protein
MIAKKTDIAAIEITMVPAFADIVLRSIGGLTYRS